MNIFKLALPGKDAKDARLSDTIVDSKYPNPKVSTIAQPPHAGIISVNWHSSIALASGTVKVIYSFKHGYDYIPTVIAVYDFDNGSNIQTGLLPFQYGALGLITIDADDTNINLKYISFDTSAPSTAISPFIMKVRFYVFVERGYE